MNQLRITEIFHSIQGESNTVGFPTVFVRTTGCPLRCTYCDTTYAFNGGQKLTISSILSQVDNYDCTHVCVTGGEPLAQVACLSLLSRLCDANYIVSLETSGALPIDKVDKRVIIVMDVKTPSSGEMLKNLYTNFDFLKPNDQIKWVIGTREDYEWSVKLIEAYQLRNRAQLLFSPSAGKLDPTLLANWILEDKIPVRFQLQLHKILWNDAPGH